MSKEGGEGEILDLPQKALIYKFEEIQDPSKVEEDVRKAINEGARRISIIVIREGRSKGEIFDKLRPVIKGVTFQSVVVWVVDSAEEAEKLKDFRLGELYG